MIPHKRILGIQGKSGSGKSTLLKLLMRFRDPQQGEILLSGHDLKEIGTRHLRGLQSYVDQHTFLFDDSIAANIKIGKPDATHEQVVEATRKASVHDFIMTLPQGMTAELENWGTGCLVENVNAWGWPEPLSMIRLSYCSTSLPAIWTA